MEIRKTRRYALGTLAVGALMAGAVSPAFAAEYSEDDMANAWEEAANAHNSASTPASPAAPDSITPDDPKVPSEDAYKDYAEYIYNRTEDAEKEKKAENDYLDKAEKEYNRLLAESEKNKVSPKEEGAKTEDPKAEAPETEAKSQEAAKPVANGKVVKSKGLAKTGGEAGTVAGIAATLSALGGGLLAFRRRFMS